MLIYEDVYEPLSNKIKNHDDELIDIIFAINIIKL